jgi:hypothetical protein
MGGSCVKLAMKEKQNNTKNRKMKLKSVSVRENSEHKNLSNHDLRMDKIKEIKKSLEKAMIIIRDKLRSEENEIQLRKDKVEKIEMEVERKTAEIAEKLLIADENLADMQSKMFSKEAGNKKVVRTLEETIGEIERASVEGDKRRRLLLKGTSTHVDSVGEEKEDGEY